MICCLVQGDMSPPKRKKRLFGETLLWILLFQSAHFLVHIPAQTGEERGDDDDLSVDDRIDDTNSSVLSRISAAYFFFFPGPDPSGTLDYLSVAIGRCSTTVDLCKTSF